MKNIIIKSFSQELKLKVSKLLLDAALKINENTAQVEALMSALFADYLKNKKIPNKKTLNKLRGLIKKIKYSWYI